MVNFTDEFIAKCDQGLDCSEIMPILQEKIEQLCKLPKAKFPMRKLQIRACIEFIRKKADIFCVLPTGYGKTMIAIVCAKYMWEMHHKKTILVGLYKSLTHEQLETFSKYMPTLIEDGDHRETSGEFKTNNEWQLAIFTPEKLDSILCNKTARDALMVDVGLIVTDEVQNLGDEGRGHVMESYLMICRANYQLRYVYLSATIGNPEVLSNWLGCSLIKAESKDRPVPLTVDFIKYEEQYYAWNDQIPDQKANYEIRLAELCKILAQYPNSQFLVFCTSRARCEQIAQYLTQQSSKQDLTSMIEKYHVGYHSAELGREERYFVEESFRNNTCRILTATPTLAAGVNLPAEHVVMFDFEQYSILSGNEVIGANRTQQSMGRAGRPGFSKVGFAHLIYADRIEETVKENATVPSIIKSCLKPRLHEKLLKWISAGLIADTADAVEMCRYALDTISADEVDAAMKWLVAFGFAVVN